MYQFDNFKLNATLNATLNVRLFTSRGSPLARFAQDNFRFTKSDHW